MSKIILKKSSVVDKVPLPGDLDYGELALNYADSKLFFKKSDNTIGTIGGGGAGSALQSRYSYTATAAQTTFSATYTAPYVDVYLNGLRLSGGTDYTATNGSTIVLTQGAAVNDLVEIVGNNTSIIEDNTKLPLTGGTLTGSIVFAAGQAFPGTQSALVSGTSIKTINGNSVLGSGNIQIDGGVTSFNTRTGAVTLSSTDVTTALGFTPYNSTNPSGYTTNTGTVTSVGGTGTVSGLTLTGTVTGSGNLTLGGTLSLTSGQVTTALGFTPYNATNPSGYITSSALSNYLPLSGGSLSGNLSVADNLQVGTTTTLGYWGSNQTAAKGRIDISNVGTSINTVAPVLSLVNTDQTLYNLTALVLGTLNGVGGNPLGSAAIYAINRATGSVAAPVGALGIAVANAANTQVEQLRITTAGVNVINALTQGGNQVLHAGNYSSYALPLSGGTTTGLTILNSYFRFHLGGETGSGVADFRVNTSSKSFVISAPDTGAVFLNWDHGTGGVNFGNGAQGVVGSVSATGAANFVGAITQNGSQVLHAGNYTSYSPTLTGGSASGTWGISITGSSASVSGLTLTSVSNPINPDSVTQNQIGYNNSVSLFGQTDGGLYSSAYSSSWIHQIYGDFRTGQIAIRGKNSGTWQAWRTVLDSSNYTNYATARVSANRPGVTKLYRSDDDSAYNIQTHWSADVSGYWSLRGFLNDSYHAPAYVGLSGRSNRANGNFYIDDNYGNTVVGVYSSVRYQGVFAMGDAYKLPADGTTTGNLYGIAWSHPNAGGVAGNLDNHGMLVLINGTYGSSMSFSIKASGNVTAYSDERLKTNWRDMPENFVARLAQVKVGIYDRIDGEQITQVGVSAQSLQNVLPEAITTATDDMQTLSVNYGGAALASAVELAKDNCELRARIERLEALINTILNKD
jgi:hypothetical protein